jgi:hypothetical protein
MNKQYIDIRWLTTFGLCRDNVLEYFYTSEFYGPKSNNQIIRNQGVSIIHLSSMTGVEYSLDAENTKEPHLYVINKNIRRSPKEVDLCEVFYCLDGIIYQSPFLLELLRTRVSKLSFNISKAFFEINNRIAYSNAEGHQIILKPEDSDDKIEIERNNKKRKYNTVNANNNQINKLMPNFKNLLADISSNSF